MRDADALNMVQEELLPLLERLCQLTKGEGDAAQLDYFERLHRAVGDVREVEDLAPPFMELSMAAFLGFSYSPPVALLLDRLLLAAQQISQALSAPAHTLH